MKPQRSIHVNTAANSFGETIRMALYLYEIAGLSCKKRATI
jgi:hypothetical protein